MCIYEFFVDLLALENVCGVCMAAFDKVHHGDFISRRKLIRQREKEALNYVLNITAAGM